MPRAAAEVDAVLDGYPTRPDTSARRLLVTVFGDTIEPRGAPVWLTSLVRLVERLGVSDRLVRTSMQRLAGEGIVEGRASGRRRFYQVAPEAKATFRRAEERIYHRRLPPWSGRWTVVVAPASGLETAERVRLRQRLGWRGFDSLVPGMLVSPSLGPAEAREVIADLDLSGKVPVMEATTDELSGPLLTGLSGALDRAREGYGDLVTRYEPVADALAGGLPAADACFALRTLLIDDLRRVVLTDPGLPDELVGEGWIGARAHALAGRIYRQIRAVADDFVSEVAEGIDGPLPPPAPYVVARFADADTGD